MLSRRRATSDVWNCFRQKVPRAATTRVFLPPTALFIALLPRIRSSDDTSPIDNGPQRPFAAAGAARSIPPAIASCDCGDTLSNFFLTGGVTTVIVEFSRRLAYHRRVTRRERAYWSSHSDFLCFRSAICLGDCLCAGTS